ncbi:MAG TPA: membrane-bound lytic murein transglycosylase MltF [Povalibacter sp.]|uniref:membrane-bound lytic murein transglycosylase MltF n=1 Tax=Povalibacter sp. TaxID=1962978 RepID=UPI002BD43FFF|nr:membrane-bound lytic murein transglycosylase MltF [Povalibacter sp.]HMN43360.1 membrane-bound lytic murein transglycosylase MltF [Povalibacter sp.]
MKIALAIVAMLLLGTCSQPPTVLEQIIDSGELRVVTRNLPSTYYLGASGPQGPEFELASQLAAELGVRLYIYSVPNAGDVVRELALHRAHIGAAGLTRGMRLPEEVAFGPPYQQVREHLIYRQGEVRARNLRQAVNTHIEVVAGSSHAASLEASRIVVPDLSWVENSATETEELLYRLSRREIDYTVADSNEFAIGRAFHPEIRIAFDLGGSKALAWAVDARDPSLLQRVTAYYAAVTAEGRLASILDTYYGDVDRFDYIQARVFMQDIEARLPQYRQWFKEAAAQIGVDWRLLAAIGYQESHWVPTATSPTGVRGLMMLTEETARALGVSDRLDPRESIFGGAQYFLLVRSQIPARIQEPDRTWMTLAAYNVGLGHLEDARILTQMHGRNPDLWSDVRDHLPLLTQSKWYTQVKRGYARGWEPVRFVENIRGYIDILDWVAADSAPPAKRGR